MRDEPGVDGGSSAHLVSDTYRQSIDAVPRAFHRAPAAPLRPLDPPIRRVTGDEPQRAAAPAWNSMLTGMAAGVVIAAVSGQWYFALFSVVTAAVTIVSWTIRVLRHRRRCRVWRAHALEAEQDFADDCRRYATELARLRRATHPSMGEILDGVRSGAPWFWRHRVLDRVTIGYAPRAITVVDGAPEIAFDDIPVLIDVVPGTVVGVHGRSAYSAAAAIIARLAAHVGPSDWNVATIGLSDETWDVVRALPHYVALDEHALSLRVAAARSEREGPGGVHRHLPTLVVVCHSFKLVRHSPVMQGVDQGVLTVIVIEEHRRDLSAVCTVIVDADDRETDGISSRTLREVCTAIARWSDPDCHDNGLPARVERRHVIPDLVLEEPTLIEEWRRRRGLGPRALVGLGADTVIDVDFDRDGAHAVVIGTTGSGKSEFLRQIVVSMAVNGSPSDVTFVLIDYKGGSAFDVCVELPHVVGVVTDLDDGMARRVLLGLRAELRRREGVLRAAGVSDIQEFHRQRWSDVNSTGGPSLARLVVVIDEVAALREDEPDFVPALAAIAQRGRSLGLHLIAASQRSTALSADVLANASIRVALRVQTAGDSLDIIGSDRAVHIDRDRPGRLIVAIGGDDGLEAQAALVSTDIVRVVDAISSAWKSEKGTQPHRPWFDPLPEFIHRPLDSAVGEVGVADDQPRQSQMPWTYTWDHHLLIVGGTGRTNAVRAIIGSLGDARAEHDVMVVSCRPDIESPWGARIDMADHEQLWRALRLCDDRVHGSHGSNQGIRRIVLAVDDLDVWRSHSMTDRIGSMVFEMFERVVTTAPIDRVVCIMTASREQGIPSSIQARAGSLWRGTGRPGVFRIGETSGTNETVVQMYWETTSDCDTVVTHADLTSALRCVPPVLVRPPASQGLAVLVDTWAEIAWSDLSRSGDAFRCLIIGPPGSGVTTALTSMARSWSDAHPGGHVMRLDQWREHTVHGEHHVLLVIDDVHRDLCRGSRVDGMVQDVLDNRHGSAHVSMIVGVSASFVRSHHDHWAQQIRRSRTGVLLGRSAEEDCDILGLHTPPLSVHRSARGRGLWVDGGSAVGIVQFFVPDES